MVRSSNADKLPIILGVAIVLTALLLLFRPSAVRALPEYSHRTGEPCAVCHVNPGGGGPRTLRGMLWTARGRPDQVPVLENTLLAPGVSDPIELYDAACAGCHGRKGEGLFATSLTQYYLTERLIHGIIVRGAPRSGMPSFAGQLTDDQLNALVAYVEALSDGQIVPPDSYPLPPAVETCVAHPEPPTDASSKSASGNVGLSCDYQPDTLTYRGN